jgi:hypothetical protein
MNLSDLFVKLFVKLPSAKPEDIFYVFFGKFFSTTNNMNL